MWAAPEEALVNTTETWTRSKDLNDVNSICSEVICLLTTPIREFSKSFKWKTICKHMNKEIREGC